MENNLCIVPELSSLLPSLNEKEFQGLEQDILERGILSPLVVWNDILIDGHHRYLICQKHSLPFSTRSLDFDSLESAKFWAWKHQEHRRNLTPYQRVEISLQFKPQLTVEAKERQGMRTDLANNDIPQNSAERRETRKELAKLADVSHDTVTRAELIAEHADESVKEKLRKGETTINAEYKRLKKEIGRRERESQKQAEVWIPLDDRVRLSVASIADAVTKVDAESVDWIVTDPPYPREYLGVYDNLAAFAQHALKPGGSLLCMVGQSYLPEILQKLNEKLDYRWTLAYLTPGGQATQLWDRKVNTFWKPVLWFTKGEYNGNWIGDVAGSKTNDNDKRHHHWGQSESGMFDLVERFLYPNMTVCDPFLGGGTTGIVALSLGCRFIGLDIEEECITKSETRLARTRAESEDSHDA
jgi:site-specific DNA-methyltransferase (adenine-specific)